MISIKKIIFLVSFSGIAAHAGDFSVGGSLGFNFATTEYEVCQHLADILNQKQALNYKLEGQNNKLLQDIKKAKKKLKKCESRERKLRWIPKSGEANITWTF